jgi:hypothetical protein
MKRFCRNQFCLEPETTLGIEFDSWFIMLN